MAPSAPPISHYLTTISLTPRALAKRTPLRYPDNAKIRALLAKPSWSVRQRLLPGQAHHRPSSARDTISVATLRHLLRLSALPSPHSSKEATETAETAEEKRMLRDLHSQIAFVQQMREVDVDVDDGVVEPLDEQR
ncbi:hypothetical protein DV735_g990, partial [Chaetothyriales sp. CBS 134920]